jgi:hypothetical protein
MKGGDMKACTLVSLTDTVIVAPLGKSARCIQVGFAGVIVVDLCGEEFQRSASRLQCRREDQGRG